MLNVLKIFLIVVLFFLLIRFFSKHTIEGARGKKRRRRRRRRRRIMPIRRLKRKIRRLKKRKSSKKHKKKGGKSVAAKLRRLKRLKKLRKLRRLKRLKRLKRLRKLRKIRKQRRKERKNKNAQQAIQTKMNGVSTGFGNIRNCAIPYSDSLQLGENTNLFGIFGNDKIVQCSKQTPKIIPAKKSKFPSGINFIPTGSSGATTTSHIKYGDQVGLCSNSNIYKITNKTDVNSSEKVKYGDNIQMIPVSGSNNTTLNVTVNPNVYGLSNVSNMNSNDFSNVYVNSYSHCNNSTSSGTLLAT